MGSVLHKCCGCHEAFSGVFINYHGRVVYVWYWGRRYSKG